MPDALDTTTTTTTNTTTMEEAPAPAPAPVPASASLECRLCDVSFTSAEEKRLHAKSEWQ